MDFLLSKLWRYSKNRARPFILPYAAIGLRNFLLSRSDGKDHNGCLTRELASGATIPITFAPLVSPKQNLRGNLCSLGSRDQRRSRIPAATSPAFLYILLRGFTLADQSECF